MTTPDRTRTLAHYIIFRSKPDRLGATKLNKVMWYSDVESYKRFGTTISGQVTYERKRYGPVPHQIKSALSDLIDKRMIALRFAMTPAGERHEYIWTQEPDVSCFSAEEIDIINRMIDWVCDFHTAAEISSKTHDPLWSETADGDEIEVRAGAVTPRPATGRYLQWAIDQAS